MNSTTTFTDWPVKPVSIKDLRSEIDICMNSVKCLKTSAEVTLSFRSMQRAFSWLGEALKASGSTSPYVSSKDPSTDKIEPQADHSEVTLLTTRWAELEVTHTARVKDFRAHLDTIISQYGIIIDAICDWNKSKQVTHCMEKSKDNLVEARMWLGWELARIKKIKEADSIYSPMPGHELPL